MKTALFALLLIAASCARAGLDEYANHLVADEARGRGGIRITYLGVNGYQFEAGGRALLVDPYFSRVGMSAIAFNQRVEPDDARLRQGLAHVQPRVDAVLVTHAHIDHLLDVPPIMRRTGARLIAGPTAVNQARALGLPAAQCQAVADGDGERIGPWAIRILAAQHDRLFGSPIIPGDRLQPGPPPLKASDWVLGEPLAFVIEAAGQRIYIDSGGQPGELPPELKVDLAILGVALSDARRRFAPAVRRLQPRFTLPTHQDDFLQPLDRGFVFGKLTDFPEVLRTWERERLPGRLILLDYFRPWTLR